MELTCPASFGRDVETQWWKQEKQPGWEIKDGKDCPVWWARKQNQSEKEWEALWGWWYESYPDESKAGGGEHERLLRLCGATSWSLSFVFFFFFAKSNGSSSHMFKWRVLHILQTLLSWKLSSTVFTLSFNCSFYNWVITFFSCLILPLLLLTLIVLVVFWLSSVLHRVHTGGSSLVVHHFEAASWSLVSFPGSSCLSDPLMCLLAGHMLISGIHSLVVSSVSQLKVYRMNP